MLVEGIGAVTYVNGIVRFQALTSDAEGKVKDSGTIEIPGVRIGDVINALSAGATGLSEKLGEIQNKAPVEEKKPKKENSKNKKK
jgi:hypothetical protein